MYSLRQFFIFFTKLNYGTNKIYESKQRLFAVYVVSYFLKLEF